MPMPWGLVISACIGMFAATASGSTRAPFLPDMALDLGVSLPAIANLFGVTATSWGIGAYIGGRLSDRIGRRVFLIGAPIGLALSMFAVGLVESYWPLVACVCTAGLFCGAFTATAMAEVSLRVDDSQRGRALGWVMSGQSLTLLIGVPASAALGAYVGWRGVHVALGALAVFSVFCVYATTRTGTATNDSNAGNGGAAMTLGEALNGPIIRLFVALIVERVCFGFAAFYYAAYLRGAYSLEIAAVALPLVGFALGNIVGTIAGGQLADRFPYRRVSFAVSLLISAGFAVPWFMWQPGLAGTTALGVGFSFFNALSRPPLLAAMADVPAEVRGVVMGLNSSVASVGWLTAALVGGWLYSTVGFGGFGPLMAVMCLVGAFTVLPDTRLRRNFGAT
jgi:MFS transporter, DHA1 family, inner membrane transport protein